MQSNPILQYPPTKSKQVESQQHEHILQFLHSSPSRVGACFTVMLVCCMYCYTICLRFRQHSLSRVSNGALRHQEWEHWEYNIYSAQTLLQYKNTWRASQISECLARKQAQVSVELAGGLKNGASTCQWSVVGTSWRERLSFLLDWKNPFRGF